jgi:hypothetical protein
VVKCLEIRIPMNIKDHQFPEIKSEPLHEDEIQLLINEFKKNWYDADAV